MEEHEERTVSMKYCRSILYRDSIQGEAQGWRSWRDDRLFRGKTKLCTIWVNVLWKF